MPTKLKKTYRFALRSSTFIFLVFSGALVAFQLLQNKFDWVLTIVFCPLVFIVSFIIIQSRVERFIYRRVKKIYDDVALLESSSFSSKPITTDMKTLTEEIGKFAQDKKIEIDTLKFVKSIEKIFWGMFHMSLKPLCLLYKVIF